MFEDETILIFNKKEVGPKTFEDLIGFANHYGLKHSLYEDIVLREWENMEFCPCDNPEGTFEYIRDVLLALKERSESNWTKDNVKLAITEVTVEYFVLYVLDRMGLTEHGGGICGSWLSEKGEKLLEKYKDYDAQ